MKLYNIIETIRAILARISFGSGQVSHRLTVVGVHARFDLRVNPQRRSLFHGAQQERLEVQKHFVVPFPVLGRLVRDDCGEVSVSASAGVENNKKIKT